METSSAPPRQVPCQGWGAFHSHPVVREIVLEVAAWCASTWSVMCCACRVCVCVRRHWALDSQRATRARAARASSAAKHSKHTTQTSTARTWASLWSLVAAAATPTTRSGQPCASPGSDLAGAAPASATQLARAHRRHLYRMPLCLGEWMREQGVERRPDLAPPRGPDRSIAWRPRARRQGGAFHSHPVVREILLEVAAWCASFWSVMFSAGS